MTVTGLKLLKCEGVKITLDIGHTIHNIGLLPFKSITIHHRPLLTFNLLKPSGFFTYHNV